MKTIRLLLVCAALATLNFQFSTAFAQSTAFTYQGVLSQNGAPASGSNDFTFTLYDAASGGNVVGTSNVVNDLLMTNGLFTVTLDFGATAFNGSARWVQIAVRPGASTGAYTNLTPRQAITATPYAITASNLSGTLPAAQLTGTLPAGTLSGTFGSAVNFNNPANQFNGDGSNLTALNATRLTTGTMADGRLSANVALRAGGNLFNGDQTLTNGSLSIGTTNHSSALRVEGNGSADSGTIVGIQTTGAGASGGVFGSTLVPGGNGVYGSSDVAGTGVSGPAAANIGVYGRSSSTNGTGISGEAAATNGLTYGVVGRTYSPQGYAGYFLGRVGFTDTLRYEGTLGGDYKGMLERYYGDNDRYGLAQLPNGITALYSSGAFAPSSIQFGQMTSPTNFTPQMVITHSGNLGIGTNSPVSALQVNGTVTASGFSGPASGLTGLNAAQLTGIVPDTQLSARVSLLGASIDSSEITDGTITTNDLSASVLNGTFWKLGGNTGANPTNGIFLGTTDNQPLELKVNNERGLRLEYAQDNNLFRGVNVIGGYFQNSVAAGAVGATIAGGGGFSVAQELINKATNDFATIGGGYLNIAGGLGATVPGGGLNNAIGEFSFAAGLKAKAIHDGTFVWSDDTSSDFASTGNNQFLIRASGGVAIGTNDPAGAALRVAGSIKADSYLGMGSTLTLGTTDNQPLEFKVNGQRGLRLEYANISGSESINVIGGYSGNVVAGGVQGATISGGGYAGNVNRVTGNLGAIGGGSANIASGNSATIGGGGINLASGNSATIGGGSVNTASGLYATIGGGNFNTASGLAATVPGGSFATASGDYSFAAGRHAQANHQGAFVWADSQNANFASTANDQFLIRAAGGVGIGTGSPGELLDVVVDASAKNYGGIRVRNINPTIGGERTVLLDLLNNDPSSAVTYRLQNVGNVSGRSGNFEIYQLGGVAGGARLAITTNGNVGIGTTSPTTEKLVVSGGVDVTTAAAHPDSDLGMGLSYESYGGRIQTFNLKPMVLNPIGNNVGIGTTSPGATLEVRKPWQPFVENSLVKVGVLNGATYEQMFEVFTQDPATVGAYGAIRLQGSWAFKVGGGSWATLSDARLKKNIEDLHGSLDRLLQLRSVSFEYKDPTKGVGPGPQIGFIAQEVQKVMPQWVAQGPDGMLAVSVTGFESLTVDALRELRAEKDEQIGELKTENAELKKRLERIERLLLSGKEIGSAP